MPIMNASDGRDDRPSQDAPGAEPGDAEQSPPHDSQRPRHPITGVEVAPLAVVVGGLVVGMIIVVTGQWRMGCLVIGAVLGVGSLERMLLPESRVGLLQARSRLLDTLALLIMAVGIIVLAVTVHR